MPPAPVYSIIGDIRNAKLQATALQGHDHMTTRAIHQLLRDFISRFASSILSTCLQVAAPTHSLQVWFNLPVATRRGHNYDAGFAGSC